ncbi:hypothetical protein QQ045_014788 [Rhodiola kirilowii]
MAAALDSDVPMIPVGEGSSTAAASSSSAKKPKRFEIKKWNAVSLWAWALVLYFSLYSDMIVDGVLQALNVKLTKLVPPVRNALLLGGSATMPFTSTASVAGSKLAKSVHWDPVKGITEQALQQERMHWSLVCP